MDSRILSSKQPLNNDLETQINVHLHESFIRDIVPSSNVHPHKTRGKHQKEYQGGVGADAANFQFFQLNKRLSQVFHLQRNIFYIFSLIISHSLHRIFPTWLLNTSWSLSNRSSSISSAVSRPPAW